METIRILLKNGDNQKSPSLSGWRVLRYRIVTVLFDEPVKAKLLYIHSSSLHPRTFRSSAFPKLAPNIITILPVVENPLLWRSDEATFFSTNTKVEDPIYLYASSDGHTDLTTKFSIIIDLEISHL